MSSSDEKKVTGVLKLGGVLVYNPIDIEFLTEGGFGKGLLSRGQPDYHNRKNKQLIGSKIDRPYQRLRLADDYRDQEENLLYCEEIEPLFLFPEEAFYIFCELGNLEIEGSDGPIDSDRLLNIFLQYDPDFIVNYIAYRKYKQQSFVIRSGLKFGVDLLLYPPSGPSKAHSMFGVRIVSSNSEHQSIMDNVRILDNISKALVCVTVQVHDTYHPMHHKDAYDFEEVVLNRWIPSKMK